MWYWSLQRVPHDKVDQWIEDMRRPTTSRRRRKADPDVVKQEMEAFDAFAAAVSGAQ